MSFRDEINNINNDDDNNNDDDDNNNDNNINNRVIYKSIDEVVYVLPTQVLSPLVPLNMHCKLSEEELGYVTVFKSFITPSGLRRCSKNRKVPGSNPTRCLAGFRDPTLVTFGSKM